MEKTIRIEFNELAKSVTTSTKIEYIFKDNDTVLNNDQILDESKELFNQAQQHSKLKTLEKQV